MTNAPLPPLPSQTPLYQLDPVTAAFVQQMSKLLNMTNEQVLSEALQLLKLAQGRQIILKDKDTSINLEIKKYVDNPTLA